jgi:hypothetical protein
MPNTKRVTLFSLACTPEPDPNLIGLALHSGSKLIFIARKRSELDNLKLHLKRNLLPINRNVNVVGHDDEEMVFFMLIALIATINPTEIVTVGKDEMFDKTLEVASGNF